MVKGVCKEKLVLQDLGIGIVQDFFQYIALQTWMQAHPHLANLPGKPSLLFLVFIVVL